MINKQKGKVVIRFGYGLGTQMFYYALYRSLQLKGINVYLDDWFLRKKQKRIHEVYRLDYFGISMHDLNMLCFDEYRELIDIGLWSLKGDKSRIKLLPFKLMKRYIIKIYNIFQIDYKIKSTHYIEKILKTPFPDITMDSRIYLQGLLQFTHKYFTDIRNVLLKDFAFNLNLPNNVQKILDDIQKNNSISLHIRRGDFVGIKDLDICTMQYYLNAIEYIQQKTSKPKFYIFSNDIDYVKSFFSFLDNYYIVDNTKEEYSDYCDLYLMTKVNHNIIPNSSFAWWGAWLNQNSNKIVIVPELWRGTQKYFVDPDYVYPSEWIRLSIN